MAVRRRRNKDCSRSSRTCRVMPENWLSALPGPVPAPLLQDESSLTSCSACTTDLILLQITLVDYSGRLACLVHSPLPFFLLMSSDYLQVCNMKVGCPYCFTFVLLQLTLKKVHKSLRKMQREPPFPPSVLLNQFHVSVFAAWEARDMM